MPPDTGFPFILYDNHQNELAELTAHIPQPPENIFTKHFVSVVSKV